MAHDGPRRPASHRPAWAAKAPDLCIPSTHRGERIDTLSHPISVSVAPMNPAPTGKHALIIEDEMLIALEVESLLHDFGFASCDIVDNSDDAVKSALAHRPDLVTADLRIVGGSGMDAMAAITRQLGPVPHIYVTGNSDML